MTKTAKTYETFVCLVLNPVTARFIAAFRRFQLASIMLGHIVIIALQNGAQSMFFAICTACCLTFFQSCQTPSLLTAYYYINYIDSVLCAL